MTIDAPSLGKVAVHDLGKVAVRDLGKVAVLLGGTSAERQISLMSGTGVLAALRSQGVDAHAFDPSERELGELKRGGFTINGRPRASGTPLMASRVRCSGESHW